MRIYYTLEKYSNFKYITQSKQFKTVLKARKELKVIPLLTRKLNIFNDFSLIQLSILREAIENYKILKAFHGLIEDQKQTISLKPQFVYKNIDIYTPLFSPTTNLLVREGRKEHLDLDSYLVTLFMLYNFSVYESMSSGLTFIRGDEHTRAYYHKDFKIIYIINDQGSLDTKICLFDRFMKNKDYSNIEQRILPVINAYYNVDKQGFITALSENDLISKKLFTKLDRKKK